MLSPAVYAVVPDIEGLVGAEQLAPPEVVTDIPNILNVEVPPITVPLELNSPDLILGPLYILIVLVFAGTVRLTLPVQSVVERLGAVNS